MQGKVLTVLVALSLSFWFAAASVVQGEIAAQEEMELVCRNWLSYMVYQKGAWAEATDPQIVDVDDMVQGDTVLARCFSIAPRGFVVVPVLKELPPIKAYSDEYRLDVDQKVGLPQLLTEVLLHRTRVFVKRYGSLDVLQPITPGMPSGGGHRAEWNRFLRSESKFEDDLTKGKFQPLAQVGPLLTTAWHQSAPYNNSCPMGDGGRCVAGCVAIAAAQIMKYWDWPPTGTGGHSYTWDGDQSCGGHAGGGSLSATFSDSYDWQNMLDDYSGGYTPGQADAVAELCYEVGVAFEMDYGFCGSGAYPSRAVTVFPTYFGYDSSIRQEDRACYTPAEWFSIIQTEINDGRPMQYKITGHSIVCDGWRDTGGQNQYHMNYGWGGSCTAWYTIDSLYCFWEPDSLCPPMEEYLIRNIIYEGGIPEEILRYDDDSAYYYWCIPHELGLDLFNVRFTPAWDCVLKSAEFLFYRKVGNGPVRIYVWDDTSGYPFQKIDSVDVPDPSVQLYPCWTTVDFTSKNAALNSLSDFHIGYTSLGPPQTDTVAILSDDGEPVGTQHRSIEFYNGAWGTMYEDWGMDLNFMIRAVVEKRSTVDTLVYDDDTPYYYWRIPDQFGDDLFNVRFTPAWDYVLKSAQFLFYYKTGIGAVRIYVWEDTSGYPAEKIDSVDVAHGHIQTVPDWTTIDFSSKTITLRSLSDFHIGYTPLGSPETDTLAILSDDGEPVGTEHRSIEFYNGAWGTMYDDWGVDVNFMIRAVVEEAETTDVEEEPFIAAQPGKFELFQNYPNPFNPQTQIRYYLPEATRVTLTIYNLLGQRVRILVEEYQNAGAKTVLWDGKDDHLKDVASGVYFYRLKTGEFRQTRKMVLIK